MRTAYDQGVFTFSLDFELVWGSRDLHADPAALLRSARITRERVFTALLDLLTSRGMVATWATVGHLFLDRADGPPADVVPPRHAWRPSWFEGVPAGTEAEHPEFYGRSLVLRLKAAGQEIGSHSFSHPIFGDEGCSHEAADTDLARCVREAEALGISLRSFVFPRNVPGHTHLLAKHGFTNWRGPEPVWYRRFSGPVSRLAHLADVAMAGRPPTVMPSLDEHGLVVIPASASVLPLDGIRRVIPLRQRVRRCLRGLDEAARARRICHLWLHPINLASDPDRMLVAMAEVFDHAARLRDAGRIEVLPMGEIALRTRNEAASSAPS